MSDDEPTARLPPIRESLRDQFKQDVTARHGSVRGHYRSETETAIEEYLYASEGGDTHDRLNRIEDRIDELTDMVGTLLSHYEKEKNSPGDVSGTSAVADGGAKGVVKRREQAVVDALRSNHSTMFSEQELIDTIEQEAGVHSEPTVEEYKERIVERFKFPYINPPNGKRLLFWNEEDRDEYYERTWGSGDHDDPWEPRTGET